jgi:hypothetical protein
MVQVSEGSGGQVFLLDPSEVATSATLLLARDGLDETLHRVVYDFEPGDRAFDVEVDPSVERVLFSISLQCLQAIDVVRPSGATVAASDPDVTWTAFQAGRQVGVRQPEPGRWQVRLAGKGLLFMVVNARSALSLDDVRLVREGGRPGHEGIFRDDAPLVPYTTRLFEIRGSGDERIGRLSPVREQSDDEDQVFLSEFRVPGVPFRVVVTGQDSTGKTVQRVQGSLFQPSRSR